MSTQEILSQVGSLSLAERTALLEAILQSVKAEIKDPEQRKRLRSARKKFAGVARRSTILKAFRFCKWEIRSLNAAESAFDQLPRPQS